ncbi:hypothetical protein HYY75_08205, partial [bacterium]|nr:hypothetical protein [bacterium]
MDPVFSIPIYVIDGISPFLEEGEKFLDAILGNSEGFEKAGELWLILSDRFIYFFHIEADKPPNVTKISRSNLRNIMYSPHSDGISLTVIPSNLSHCQFQIPFKKNQRTHLNKICVELWKEIEIQVLKPDEITKSKLGTRLNPEDSFRAKPLRERNFLQDLPIPEKPEQGIADSDVEPSQPSKETLFEENQDFKSSVQGNDSIDGTPYQGADSFFKLALFSTIGGAIIGF